MTIKEADIRPREQPEPQRASPKPPFPWGAVLVAAAIGALLGAGITALVFIGRVPGAEAGSDAVGFLAVGTAGQSIGRWFGWDS
jgi:hypothetical protein